DVAVVTAEVDHLSIRHGRSDNTRTGGEFPFHAMKLARSGTAIDAGMRGISAEHRLRICRVDGDEAEREKKENFHVVLQFVARFISTGISIGPCVIIPLMPSFPARPSKLRPVSAESTMRNSFSCLTR